MTGAAAPPRPARGRPAPGRGAGDRRPRRRPAACPHLPRRPADPGRDHVTVRRSDRERRPDRMDSRSRSVAARRERRLDRLVLEDAPRPAPSSRRPCWPASANSGSNRSAVDAGAAPTPVPRRPDAPGRGRRQLGRPVGPGAPRRPSNPGLRRISTGQRSRPHLARLDLARLLTDLLGRTAARRLDAEAPTHLTVPSGSRIPLEYGQGESSRRRRCDCREMFGLRATPTVADGRVPVLVHLLSPAGGRCRSPRTWRASGTAATARCAPTCAAAIPATIGPRTRARRDPSGEAAGDMTAAAG